jgi:antitoxin (DNA-binding transcriptional repressor) of toxin-antitoxin stability system
VIESHSDNLTAMAEVSATDAARNFAGLLDAVEHRGEHFAIVRRGKVVAHLEPVSAGRGADVKAMLRRHRTDPRWAADLLSIRQLVELEDRP